MKESQDKCIRHKVRTNASDTKESQDKCIRHKGKLGQMHQTLHKGKLGQMHQTQSK